MSFDEVRYEPGAVARIVLDRPERRNAQSWKLLEEMDRALTAAVADPEVRVIVLSGAGRSFSAGHDLDSPEQREHGRERFGGLDDFARGELLRDVYIDSHLRWRDLPKPTVAMVHGYCIYGGWMIASAMDVVFAADDALLIPVYGDYFTASWDVGARKAKEILYENRFMTAMEAMTWGFVNRVYPAAELESRTMRYATRVCEQDPFSTRTVKFAINQTLDTMGFTTSVRAVAPDFLRRRRRQPEASRSQASDSDPRFRSQVERALSYLREDGIEPPR